MNQILEWLAIGDLRSDGQANEVATLVLAQPAIFPDLLAALDDKNDAVRGHAADALEKVSREMPELFIPHLEHLMRIARTDDVAMVRWHLAMIFGNLAYDQNLGEMVVPLLLDMLGDENAFVKSWCISGLVIWGGRHPQWRQKAVESISPLIRNNSIGVSHRAEKAIHLLLDERASIPPGWVKSKR